MKRENADVARHELIGLFVTVRSAHAEWNGLEGTVVDETKHTFLVERASRPDALVPKAGQRFVFRVGTERFDLSSDELKFAAPMTAVIEGDDIKFRPEDRTKKVRM